MYVLSVRDTSEGVAGLVAALRRDSARDLSAEDGDNPTSAGENPSFDTVLRLFHKKIFNLSYRLLGDLDEAADLTQETFVKAYKAYPGFVGSTESVYPWLCRIAVNGCKNKYREMGRRNRYEVVSLDEPLDIGDAEIDRQLGDDSANPAGLFERQELEAKVQEAIQELPPEYRVVVVLRDLQGLSYREIADATSLTPDTVKVRLFRGRQILRRRLAHYVGE